MTTMPSCRACCTADVSHDLALSSKTHDTFFSSWRTLPLRAAHGLQDSASAQITQEGHVQPAADVQRIVSEARRVVVE